MDTLAMRNEMEEVWLRHNPDVQALFDTCVRGCEQDLLDGVGVETVATLTFDRMFGTQKSFGLSYEKWQFETALRSIIEYLKDDSFGEVEDAYADVFIAHAEDVFQMMCRYVPEGSQVPAIFVSFWRCLPDYLEEYDGEKPLRNWLLARAVRHCDGYRVPA